jgi:hypothetical protein
VRSKVPPGDEPPAPSHREVGGATERSAVQNLTQPCGHGQVTVRGRPADSVQGVPILTTRSSARGEAMRSGVGRLEHTKGGPGPGAARWPSRANIGYGPGATVGSWGRETETGWDLDARPGPSVELRVPAFNRKPLILARS